MTPAEQRAVADLTPSQLDAISAALLAEVGPHWRKAAMVIAGAMEVPAAPPGVPDSFYAARLAALAAAGQLDVRGDLTQVRFSEVRQRESFSL